MKKLILVLLTALFLAGCGTAAKESEFWEHDTMYRNWNHMGFSWWEYKQPPPSTADTSMKQKWWGKTVGGK